MTGTRSAAVVVGLALIAACAGDGDDDERELGAHRQTRAPDVAAQAGLLPPAGPAEVGGVALPPGRPRRTDPTEARLPEGTPAPDPAVWITDRPVGNISDLWARLRDVFPKTGLWPVALVSFEDDGSPWLSGGFYADPGSDPASVDAETVLREAWRDPGTADLAPFDAGRFPGLAPAVGGEDDPDLPRRVLHQWASDDVRLALVPVTRAADVITKIGWGALGGSHVDLGKMAAVFRSWEERFGATLMVIDPQAIYFAVSRPPRNFDEALRVSAEQRAICVEVPVYGQGGVRGLADHLLRTATWDCYWD